MGRPKKSGAAASRSNGARAKNKLRSVARVWPNGVIKERLEAAKKRAAQMLEQCADADPRTKMAKLRTRVKGLKTPIKFKR